MHEVERPFELGVIVLLTVERLWDHSPLLVNAATLRY